MTRSSRERAQRKLEKRNQQRRNNFMNNFQLPNGKQPLTPKIVASIQISLTAEGIPLIATSENINLHFAISMCHLALAQLTEAYKAQVQQQMKSGIVAASANDIPPPPPPDLRG